MLGIIILLGGCFCAFQIPKDKIVNYVIISCTWKIIRGCCNSRSSIEKGWLMNPMTVYMAICRLISFYKNAFWIVI
jgi:hypothetical protein